MPSAPTTQVDGLGAAVGQRRDDGVAAVVDLGDGGATRRTSTPGADHLLGQDVGDVAAHRAHRAGQVGAAHRRRRDLGDDVAVGGLEPQVAEREAPLGQPVVDADRLERLERVALEGDAVARRRRARSGGRRGPPRRPRWRSASDRTPPVMPPPTTRTRLTVGLGHGVSWGTGVGHGAGHQVEDVVDGAERRREVEEAVQHAVGLHVAYVDAGLASSSANASPVVRRSSYSAVTSTVGARPARSARAGKE